MRTGFFILVFTLNFKVIVVFFILKRGTYKLHKNLAFNYTGLQSKMLPKHFSYELRPPKLKNLDKKTIYG